MPTPDPTDPVLARRAAIARWTDWGRRTGYGLLGVALVVFVVGAVAGMTQVVVVVVVACLAGASAVLAPAIVFGYAVRAAEREDRELAARRRAPPA